MMVPQLTACSDELQRIFDEQIDRIIVLVDEQLRIVHGTHAGETISYMILSGGLGSSPYVQKRMKERYERGAGRGFVNAQSMSVLVATEPQLAVTHGLVLARSQALKGGPEVLSTRKCPVSYGVVCREAYDPAKHQGADVEQDPLDKKRWAERQVSWFIKQVRQSRRCSYGPFAESRARVGSSTSTRESINAFGTKSHSARSANLGGHAS